MNLFWERLTLTKSIPSRFTSRSRILTIRFAASHRVSNASLSRQIAFIQFDEITKFRSPTYRKTKSLFDGRSSTCNDEYSTDRNLDKAKSMEWGLERIVIPNSNTENIDLSFLGTHIHLLICTKKSIFLPYLLSSTRNYCLGICFFFFWYICLGYLKMEEIGKYLKFSHETKLKLLLNKIPPWPVLIELSLSLSLPLNPIKSDRKKTRPLNSLRNLFNWSLFNCLRLLSHTPIFHSNSLFMFISRVRGSVRFRLHGDRGGLSRYFRSRNEP